MGSHSIDKWMCNIKGDGSYLITSGSRNVAKLHPSLNPDDTIDHRETKFSAEIITFSKDMHALLYDVEKTIDRAVEDIEKYEIDTKARMHAGRLRQELHAIRELLEKIGARA